MLGRGSFALVVVAWIGAVVAADVKRIHVLTQNVQLTPLVGGTQDQQVQRAGRLVDAILRANPPYDIIGMQEVFMAAPMQVLIDGLSHQFPNLLTALPNGAPISSGLFLASRFPIKRSTFHKYEHASGADALAAKGVVVAEFNVSSANGASSGNLVVALTHQQSDDADITPSQLQEGGKTLATFLQQSDRSLQDVTTVLYMGDMNIDEVSQQTLYSQMKSTLGQTLTDLYRDQNPNDPGLTWPLPTPQQRLDYIFNIKQVSQNTCQFDQAATFFNASVDHLVANGTLSDHFGSTVTFDMSLKPNGEMSSPVACVPPSTAKPSAAHSDRLSVLALLGVTMITALPLVVI